MTAESSGQLPSRDDRQRFALPADDVAPGRSQPKRKPPPRRDGNPQLLHRVARGVATFGISLALVTISYRLLVSKDFAEAVFENGATTASVALLIGCFALPITRRKALKVKQHLVACLATLAITPWPYVFSNRLNDSGSWMAPGFNFIAEIFLAVIVYRLIARRQAATRAHG